MSDKVNKPLFDGRAEFSALLVKKVGYITEMVEKRQPDLAFRGLLNFYHLTHVHMKTTDAADVKKLFENANKQIANIELCKGDTSVVYLQFTDVILPKLMSGTMHLLMPVQSSDEDDIDALGDKFFQ